MHPTIHPTIPSNNHHYADNEVTTSEGLREVGVHTLSLARLVRAARRAKKEARVVIDEWNKNTFISDVFGPRDTWFVPEFEASEWGFILYLFKTHSVTRVMRLSITTVGSVIIPPLGVVLYSRFLLSTSAGEKVRYVGEKYADRNKEADEDWWFINGTGVNGDLQAANGYHISEIFHKQVRLFYNPTTGLLFDFAQCVVGLISYKTRPSALLAKALLNRFAQSPTVKIILIVHSMGSIISANAIKYMIRKGWTKDLHRLELYTFGSPSVEFLHVIDKRSMTRVPFYEHYCNTSDYISRIGTLRLQTNANWWAIGRVFSCQKQGHFFGEHYLPSVARREYTWRGSTEHSRLYSYIPVDPIPITYPVTSSPYALPDYKVNPRRPRRNRWSLTARRARSNSSASTASTATPTLNSDPISTDNLESSPIINSDSNSNSESSSGENTTPHNSNPSSNSNNPFPSPLLTPILNFDPSTSDEQNAIPTFNASTSNQTPPDNSELEATTFIPLDQPLPSYITAPEPSAEIPADSLSDISSNSSSSGSSSKSSPTHAKRKFRIPFFRNRSNEKPAAVAAAACQQ